jgi:hypothetical protein
MQKYNLLHIRFLQFVTNEYPLYYPLSALNIVGPGYQPGYIILRVGNLVDQKL